MTQHVLLILREGEPPRILGPYALAAGALAEAAIRQLIKGEFLVQPLEPPRHFKGGRHALIPSPVPRDAKCLSCGQPYLPTHSTAAPGLTVHHPFKSEDTLDPTMPDHLAYMASQFQRPPDLAAGGRPITNWVEHHADQLRRFVPRELPRPPKEIEP